MPETGSERVDGWIEARRRAARSYFELLEHVPGLVLLYEAPDAKHVYHQYVVRILRGRRDAVRARLSEAEIDTMVYNLMPVHRLPIYRHLAQRLPVAEAAAEEIWSLPIWSQITLAVQERVAGTLCNALA